MIRFCLLSSLTLVLSACNETLIKGNGNLSGGIINVSSISFADVDREIFQARCTSCHGNAGGVNLQSYENVKANANRAKSAIDSGRMPPGGPLSNRAKQLLALWISKGMPLEAVVVDPGESGGDNGGGDDTPPLPPLAPTYTSLKANVFSARCTGCHSSNSRLIPLTSREEIINPRAGLVNFNNPEKSLLLKVIQNRTNPQQTNQEDNEEEDDDDNLQMPPINSGISPVPNEHLQTIEEWIRRGAPE